MADQSTGPQDPRWLVEPGPGEAQIHLALGDGAVVTPALRAAVEALAGALQRDEVQGYARPCKEKQMCVPFGKCAPELSAPCAVFTTCRIKD
jgi:hypothetical protein